MYRYQACKDRVMIDLLNPKFPGFIKARTATTHRYPQFTIIPYNTCDLGHCSIGIISQENQKN